MSQNPNEEKALAPVTYVPGGLNPSVVKANVNPTPSNQNHPFAAGLKINEVMNYQNFFTFPLDTEGNIFDAITYFSEAENRNRYSYEQQQLIISRIVRAAIDFEIPIEGVREKLQS
ncbi:hypothetical protein [Candidatus Chlorohelix sp.]|uniref:hypothetical protein n=1 Tax=Candidatus Chlorohelix sp. TaxID=3139201 RepID=UPI0030665275